MQEVITYNSLISTCASGKQLGQAWAWISETLDLCTCTQGCSHLAIVRSQCLGHPWPLHAPLEAHQLGPVLDVLRIAHQWLG